MIAAAATIFSPLLRSAQPLACRLFEAAVGENKLANAYLLVGPACKDKLALAQQLACYFNCGKKSSRGPCTVTEGECSQYCLNCAWIAAGEHPQAWLTLDGEGKSGKIPVEKARRLTDELGKTSAFVRTVVVPQSDEQTFHRPAANTLLKSIEEPPGDTLFFLFAESQDDVLATIVSRCQVVPLSKPISSGLSVTDKAEIGEMQAKLAAARAEFIMSSRKHFGEHTASNQYFKTVSEGLALSRQLQELCKQLQEVMDEQEAAAQVLDLFVAAELEVFSENIRREPAAFAYVQKLFDLSERSKRQINQYVKPSNALESFSLSLIDVRQAFSGDLNLAKR